MKKIKLILLVLVAVFATAQFSAQAVRHTKNEHRAVWVTNICNDWPGATITSSNAKNIQMRGRKMLDSLVMNNFTTVYFHVRSLCDAKYKSSYEPWAADLSGTRGVAPIFDPLQFILEESHKRGLECYAWINPFRYASASTAQTIYGPGELNYENSHPEWLLRNDKQTILNPALPEVHDQIVKVCKELVTNYDVDGVVMDDYFYPQGGTSYSVDADLYNQYKANGGTLDQGDWRRDNVNRLIDRLGKEIKAVKPWVRYGASPAGASGKSAEEHGLPPTYSGMDWQYNQIFSDPLAWMFGHSIDFLSPQLYWPIGHKTNDFKGLSKWWQMAADESNTQLFPSQWYERGPYTFTEYRDEVNWLRENTTEDGATGLVVFSYSSFVNARQTVTTPEGKKVPQSLLDQIRATAFPYTSYTPPMNWDSNGVPDMPDNVKNNAGTLTWVGPENVRFAIYAYPESETAFAQQVEYLIDLSYEKSYTIPEDFATGYKYAVSTLDRWSVESGAALEGQALKAAPALKMLTPTQNSKMYIFSDFSWMGECTSFVLEIAKDAAMKDIVFSKEVANGYVARQEIKNIDSNGTYYCRVIGKTPGYRQAVSEIVKFEIAPFDVIYPANGQEEVELQPNLQWSDLGGAEYTVTIARDKAMTDVVYSQKTKDATLKVGSFNLFAGENYYIQVAASNGMREGTSEPSTFKTLVMAPATAEILNPANDGDVVYSNQSVKVAPKEGMLRTRIEISKTDKFSSRSSYSANLSNYNFTDEHKFETVKVAGKNLVDGQKYYVRARHEAVNKDGGLDKGEWTMSSFIYSKDLGVESATINEAPYISGTSVVVPQGAATVYVYNASGAAVMAEEEVAGELSLESLAQGIYLVKVSQEGKNTVLKFIR